MILSPCMLDRVCSTNHCGQKFICCTSKQSHDAICQLPVKLFLCGVCSELDSLDAQGFFR